MEYFFGEGFYVIDYFDSCNNIAQAKVASGESEEYYFFGEGFFMWLIWERMARLPAPSVLVTS